jgi:hypothetical protein
VLCIYLFRFSFHIDYSYIKRYIGIVSTEDDIKWNELVAPAPMVIAVLSQLMICTSHVTDFPINKIKDKNKIPLIKHPESFRTTLVQIVNEAYNAFKKAHASMEKIQSQVAQLAVYVIDCVEIIKSDNKVDIEKLVPRRLECIKQAADDGLKLLKEVHDAFDLLGQLIQQVLLAFSDSRGAKEQEIQDAIKANMLERKERQEESIKREKEYLRKEVEDNQHLKNIGQQYVMEEQQRSRGILERIFFPGEKEKIAGFERSVKDAEERLKKAKQDAADAEKNIDKICDECTESLRNMQVDVDEDISTDRMIQILKDGTQQLGKLQENWTGMTLYFKSINSNIEKVMKKQQNIFVGDAKDAQENTFLIDSMAESIKKSLESSIKSHRTAATYVKVSNNYIMGPLRNMHGMLALEPEKIKQAQKELIDSCERASKGIQIMFNEDGVQTIPEIENALQSPDPFKVLFTIDDVD